ncbi:hypothetical protein KUH32_02905 [Thalassococcus sp. CAU 1522]|uniref:Uncharacterized protein n=1 Tax=Thalassococcus arenae TaxID=2851652 RepID=A0ABS6N3W8_9RHOB|nr:hypothetical protein [Thalassococcus arenae]MBV2358709.1 hypothetical protein [Thalassococcus arenae]
MFDPINAPDRKGSSSPPATELAAGRAGEPTNPSPRAQLLAAAQTVETAAYSLAGQIDRAQVADLIIIAASLERIAGRLDKPADCTT